MAIEAERESLYEWVVKEFPTINVLINNAGILAKGKPFEARKEMETVSKGREACQRENLKVQNVEEDLGSPAESERCNRNKHLRLIALILNEIENS